MVPGTQGCGAIYCLQCKFLLVCWYGIYQHDLRGNNVRVCLMAAGTEPKIKGTGQLLLINAIIHAGLVLVVYAIGGAKCSIGSNA